MYKVTVEGAFAGYSDTVVYVKVAENGSYVPCGPAEAGGVCVKLPYEHTDEDGNTVKTAEDTSGALLVEQAEEVINILTGGNSE